MTQDSLLRQDDNQVQIDENKDYLAELVGEGKKFKDVSALAKAKAYSDAHISILERRFDELSADYVKQRDSGVAGAKLQELLDKLETAQQQLTSREPPLNSNEDIKPALAPDQIDSLVSNKILQHEQTRKEQDNYKIVQDKLAERLGDNYKSVLAKQAQTLGLTEVEVNTMARTKPQLFFKTFDLNEPVVETFQGIPRSSSSFSPKGAEKRGWKYYEKMQKENPTAWLDKKIAIQMEKDAQAMGLEAFYAS